MFTHVSIPTFPSFNISMFTEEGGTTINNEGRIILNTKKMLKCTQFCNF